MFQIIKSSSSNMHEICDLAFTAMIKEVELTPKPGLVDKQNSGSHHDMNCDLFRLSAKAIQPYLVKFYIAGFESASSSPEQVFKRLQQIGVLCETKMFESTQGVNTHKGMIFALAIILGAIGRTEAKGKKIDIAALKYEIKCICFGLVERNRKKIKTDPNNLTAGEEILIRHGLKGARGQAQSGFPVLFSVAIPYYQLIMDFVHDEDISLHMTLLRLISINEDTNLIKRGGLEGMEYCQDYANQILKLFEPRVFNSDPNMKSKIKSELVATIEVFDNNMKLQNLSPGGSADMLALTWFLAQLV